MTKTEETKKKKKKNLKKSQIFKVLYLLLVAQTFWSWLFDYLEILLNIFFRQSLGKFYSKLFYCDDQVINSHNTPF